MKRNKFSLSHYKLLTLDMGYLVPIAWYEVLPGDTWQQQSTLLVRASPLVAPPMHPVMIRVHHWFVPNRLIWEDWEDFITGGEDGLQTPEWPYKSVASVAEGGLHDYLGVPVGTYSPNLEYSALPIRAYQMIYNENYRDQDLQSEIALSIESGVDSTTAGTLNRVAWEKDYFTSARPWQQKGPEVTIPIGDTAPVIGLGKLNQNFQTGPTSFHESDGGSRNYNYFQYIDGAGVDYQTAIEGDAATGGYPNVRADLTSATGVDINDLRLALALQRYEERIGRHGSRYSEYLRYLGVRPSDGRLQQPEYLGGGRQVIQFSEVIQTAEGTDPVGSIKGHGIAALRSNRFRRFFPEHGIVMSLMSVVPKAIYTTALHKKWSRTVKEDYYMPELAMIGEQEVFYKEIQADHSTPDDVFGYQARYDEYRSHPSQVSGEFLSTMDHWHYGRQFSGDVALNSSFITCSPAKRPHADEVNDTLWVMANHMIRGRRLMNRIARTRTF